MYRDTKLIVKLNNIKDNVDMAFNIGKKPMIAIVKANAYGHGDYEVAKLLENNDNVLMFGVATLLEGIELRKKGIKKDIIVIGSTRPKDVKEAIKNNIIITIFSISQINELDCFIENKKLRVHLKVDTGMNRIGVKDRAAFETAYQLLSESKKYIIEGVFTHFASAEIKDDTYQKQLELFKSIIDGYNFKWIHANNSAGTLYHLDDFTNLNRLGIAMYGVAPRQENEKLFKPTMALTTKVIHIKEIDYGEKVGYNFTYTTEKRSFIATLPIGYADGLVRKNQGRNVYINGKLYPIVGRICMDQTMVLVDETVKLDDDVEIFGDNISINKMAIELDTIAYEVMCLITQRVPREY